LGDTKHLSASLIRSTSDEGNTGCEFHIHMANFARAATTYSHCDNLKSCPCTGSSRFYARVMFLKMMRKYIHTYIEKHVSSTHHTTTAVAGYGTSHLT